MEPNGILLTAPDSMAIIERTTNKSLPALATFAAIAFAVKAGSDLFKDLTIQAIKPAVDSSTPAWPPCSLYIVAWTLIPCAKLLVGLWLLGRGALGRSGSGG